VLVGGLTAGDSGNSLFNATIERIEDGAVVDSIGQFNVTSSISVELNTRTKKVTTNGLPPTVATLRERWFILKPGDNTIRVTASSSGGGRLFAYYYERYV
jgi:phage-related protein